jgi:hypothetical protein
MSVWPIGPPAAGERVKISKNIETVFYNNKNFYKNI